jgi:hypothetical protein
MGKPVLSEVERDAHATEPKGLTNELENVVIEKVDMGFPR